MSELPSVVDVAWLEGELGADDLFLGDVRGPNAHARGHIPGSRPLVLGSPPPMSDRDMLEALAPEVGLRLRRHGVTGEERLVLYDRGDGMGAMPAAQMAELAGHPRVAILLGGVAAWSGELQLGQVELHPVKTRFEPRFDAVPTRDELASRLDDTTLMILDVRSEEEFRGKHGYPCDPRQGRIPGARHVPVQELFAGPGEPLAAGSDQGATRRPARNRCVLPLRVAVRVGDALVASRGVPRAQLRRLVARVVAPRRPAIRKGLTPTRPVAPTAWCQTPCRKCDAPRTRSSRGTGPRPGAVTSSRRRGVRHLAVAREHVACLGRSGDSLGGVDEGVAELTA